MLTRSRTSVLDDKMGDKDGLAKRLRRFYEESPVMMHAIDENGIIELVSDRWLRRLGYDRAEVVGRPSIDFLTEESRRKVQARMADFRSGGIVEDEEHDVMAKSGEVIHVMMSATTEVDEDGNFLRSMAVLEDVTERRRLARETLQLNERLSLALKASGIGIWDWDIVNNDLHWDDQMYRIYGTDPDDFDGAFEAWSAALVPETREQEKAKVARALAGEEKFDTEFRVVHPTGEVRTIRGMGDVFRGVDGQPLRMLGANWDVTREKATEEEMASLIDQLRNSNEDLERFAYIASHDLREPLRGMRNFSSFLIEDYGDKLDDEGLGYLATIDKLGGRLEAYLEDLLRYARLGQEEMAVQMVDMAELLGELCDTVRDSHEPASVSVEIEGSMPRISVDPVKLSMVFGNLLRNGLKYNESSTPRVTVRYQAQPEAGMHEFVVEDNGIGIKPDQRERIFTLFKRLHAKDAYGGGGTGMGLTLVKRAVERHGGTVEVESEPGKGSAFRVVIQELTPPGLQETPEAQPE